MTVGQALTFLLFAVVAAITPGPSNLILTSTGARVGLLRGILKWGGIGFLLWLSWKIDTAGRSDATTEKQPLGFWGAAAFQWINPKSWLVSVSAVSVYLHPAAGTTFTQAISFGLLFILAALPSCFLWLAFGASLQRFLSTKRTARIFNVAMGVLLAGSVLLFIW